MLSLRKIIACALLLLFMPLSCSSEQTGGGRAQKLSGDKSGTASTGERAALQLAAVQHSVEIVANDAHCDPTFYAVPRDSDISAAHITWMINGSAIAGVAGAQFKSGEIKKNDRIQARATIGKIEVLSDVVQVANCPPQIDAIKIMPEIFKPQDVVFVDVVTKDADNDPVQVHFAWSKNGAPAGEDRSLTVPLKRGDRISITATPFDGEAYGAPATLNREILNYPPEIIEHSEYVLNNNMLTYHTKAQDPDGDVLAFSLETTAKDMEIDPVSGELRWSVSGEFKGKEKAAIVVHDGHGGSARYVLQITIR